MLVGLLIGVTSQLRAASVLTLLTGFTLILTGMGLSLMHAKRHAMRSGQGTAWFGLISIAAWDPNQGVLFLKDKMIGPVDSNPHDGGGVMLLLPWLGEELAFCAPLEVRTTKFEDKDVVTREYVPLTIKGAIYWRVVDLERFYLSVSRSIHHVDDQGGHRIDRRYDCSDISSSFGRSGERGRETACQLEAGEEWLRLIAEEQTRAEVMNARTGLLVADNIVGGLPSEMQSLLAADSYQNATEGIAESIRRRIEGLGTSFGIQVDRVSLQEVQLDKQIREQAIKAAKSAYDPLISQRASISKKMGMEADAYGRQKMLEGEAEVIGRDAVGQKEVLANLKPFAIGGRHGSIMEVLNQVFESGEIRRTQQLGGHSVVRKGPHPSDQLEENILELVEESEPSVFVDREASAKLLLTKAKQEYEAGAINEAIQLLEDIIRQFDGTRAADFARDNLNVLRSE